MQINNFKEMYFADLSELRSAEIQLVDALAKMAEAAQHDELKQALTRHREQTQSQRDRVDGLLRRHGLAPDEHQDQAMQALVREAEKMQGILTDPKLRDAGLIDAAQRIEHYEIASYGTAATYADVLGYSEDRTTLHEILEEEKAADAKLTVIAEAVVNRDALGLR